jgi:DNA repair protein RadC
MNNILYVCETPGVYTIATAEQVLAYSKKIADVRQKRKQITSREEATQFLKLALGLEKTESFGVIFLDNSLKVIKVEIVSTGVENQCAIYVRQILKQALLLNSTNLILAHNHPTGVLKPSNEDVKITKDIIDAAKTLDISVLDHIIITGNGELSFKACGLI